MAEIEEPEVVRGGLRALVAQQQATPHILQHLHDPHRLGMHAVLDLQTHALLDLLNRGQASGLKMQRRKIT